jgi:hypothetical protein
MNKCEIGTKKPTERTGFFKTPRKIQIFSGIVFLKYIILEVIHKDCIRELRNARIFVIGFIIRANALPKRVKS